MSDLAKSTRITFSREHSSRSNPEPHVDVYRQPSDSAHVEKIDHCPTDSGHGNDSMDVPVRVEK